MIGVLGYGCGPLYRLHEAPRSYGKGDQTDQTIDNEGDSTQSKERS